jgi:hypothetical protein
MAWCLVEHFTLGDTCGSQGPYEGIYLVGCEISGSHGGEYEEDSLLGYCAM